MLRPYLLLAIVLLACGAMLAFGIVALMAMALLRPPRMTDGKAIWVLKRISPGDLRLNFEDVAFFVRDESSGKKIKLAAWWIPSRSPSRRTVVLLHGYADAKVGVIAWAPLWHSLDFNILALDLRAHGYSEGRYCTAGFWERHDVKQVLDELRAQRGEAASQIILFGASLGAQTALAVAAMDSMVAGVVADSPPASFAWAAKVQMDLLAQPGSFFQRLALGFAQRIGECDFDSVRPLASIPSISCPILIIAPNQDLFLPQPDRDALEAALHRIDDGRCAQMWHVESSHLMALHDDPAEYSRRIAEFTDLCLASPAQ